MIHEGIALLYSVLNGWASSLVATVEITTLLCVHTVQPDLLDRGAQGACASSKLA